MKKIVKTIALAATFGLVAGTTFQGVNFATENLLSVSKTDNSSSNESSTISKTSLVNTNSSTSSDSSSSIAKVAKQVLPSVVAIDVTEEQVSYDFFRQSQSSESTGTASGIIVAEKNNKLYIATNNHVVADAKTVKVRFGDAAKEKSQGLSSNSQNSDKDSNSTDSYEAKVKGTDSVSDLAIIEVEKSNLSDQVKNNIKIATIGNSDDLEVGDEVIAIGNALGYGTSVTVGYISAKDREISSEDSESIKLLQTDAAINPGNSGGALVNTKGEVIGINSSKFASEEIEGMGFAIPISTADSILSEIIDQEKISESDSAYLGITGQDVTDEYANYYNMPEGIYITNVTDNSPASKAGLLQGNIITKINGKEVKNLTSLKEKLASIKGGSEGEITVMVNDSGQYKEKTLKITFSKKGDSKNYKR